jgi:O-antigen/teichoic acid export membrane protein
VKIKSIIQNLGANLLTAILGLVGSIILARWLGPTQRGIFAAIILIPSILQYIVNLGLYSSTIFFTAQNPSNKHKIWSNLFCISLIQSILGFLLGWFLLNFYLQKFPFDSVRLGHLYLLIVPIGLIGMYATFMLQGASFFRLTNILKCIVPTGYCVGIIALYWQNTITIEHLVYLQIFIQSCYLLVSVFFLDKYLLQNFTFSINFNLMREMLTYGLKVWIGDISFLANARIDQLLIGAFLLSRDLGIYTIAVSIASFTGVFSRAVATIVLPIVAGKSTINEQKKEIIDFFKRYWILSIVFHLTFAVSVWLMLPLIFGKEYNESVRICQILVIGYFFINAKSVLAEGIQGMGFPEMISIVEVFGMVMSLILSLLLIKPFGLIGASIAITIAYFSQFLGVIIFAHKKDISYLRLLYPSRKEIIDDIRWLKKYFSPKNEKPFISSP